MSKNGLSVLSQNHFLPESMKAEELSSCSPRGYELHSDGIIPQSEAYQLQIKKTSNSLSPQIKTKQLDFTNFQIKTKEDLKAAINRYKSRLSSLHRPLKSHTTSAELKEKEEKLKEKLKKEREEKLAKIKKQYDEKKAKIIEDKRDCLQKFWRGKMFGLNGKLQEAEWRKNSKQTEEEEKIKSYFERAYKEALKNDSKELEAEIEEHFSKQLQDKLSSFSPKSMFKDKNELKSALEGELDILRLQERMKWDVEKKKLREVCEASLEKENSKIFKNFEQETKEKYLKESQWKIENFKNELREKTEPRKVGDCEFYSEWIDECESEALNDDLSEVIYKFKQELLPNLTREIKRSISVIIESKIVKPDQERIFKEVGEELSTTFELFKKETDSFYKKQLKISEESFKESISDKIEKLSKDYLLAVEKEIHIKYLQSFEKQKQMIKKMFDEKDSAELKKLREKLVKEKQDLAQYRAKNNIQISKIEERIRNNIKKLDKDTAKVEAKVKEIQLKNKLETQGIRKDKILSKTPSRPKTLGKSALSPDLRKDIPLDFVPTCSSSKGVHANYEFSTKLNSPYRVNSPKDAVVQVELREKTTPREAVNAKSLSFDYFKIQQRDQLNISSLRQNMYHELLKEKFGFIEPRLR